MKKKTYVAPETEMRIVELEQGFMNASADIQNPDSGTGRIQEHEVNQDFDFTFSNDGSWNHQGDSQN